MRRCIVCDSIIPQERLGILPDTHVCILHSNEKKKTENQVELDTSDLEDMKRMVRTPNGER